MSQSWVGAVAGIVLTFGVVSRASAETELPSGAEPKPAGTQPASQENFGIGAQIGFYNPNGLAVRLGAKAVSLELAAGVVPALLSYGGSRQPTLKFIFPLEVSPQLVIHVVTFRHDMEGALRLGYRYNRGLGHGATLGGQLSRRVTPRLALEGMWGVSYYPRAADRLRGEYVPEDTGFNFPPELGYGLTVGLLFYP